MSVTKIFTVSAVALVISAPSALADDAQNTQYTVQSGDNLWSISAEQLGVKPNDKAHAQRIYFLSDMLASANAPQYPALLKDQNKIYPNMTLSISGELIKVANNFRLLQK